MTVLKQMVVHRLKSWAMDDQIACTYWYTSTASVIRCHKVVDGLAMRADCA